MVNFLDIAGQGDGSVSIWEWGHVGVVSQPRAAGAYAKVNRLRFNSQGNKFGVADGDGHVALWTLRLGGGNVPHHPFFVRFIHFRSRIFPLLLFLAAVIYRYVYAKHADTSHPRSSFDFYHVIFFLFIYLLIYLLIYLFHCSRINAIIKEHRILCFSDHRGF